MKPQGRADHGDHGAGRSYLAELLLAKKLRRARHQT